ncbi:MAG: quinone-dependent dihydroorotate dehydrogenase [Chthoniobacterales bacterium]
MLYQKIARPFFFCLDPEDAHEAVLKVLVLASNLPVGPWLLKKAINFLEGPVPGSPRSVAGIHFPNPVGLAAGMDKNGVALLAWEALGFGFVEIGTITAQAQPGNPKPRLFRFPEQEALVNRLGFNNQGAVAVATRLKKMKEQDRWPRIPIGINIGKSRVTPVEEAAADYLLSFQQLHGLGDYYVLNVSSPNTPGLRDLQAKEALATIVKTIRDWEGTPQKPLFVKVAPDLAEEDLMSIVALAEEEKLSGLIATNTTLDHTILPKEKDQVGGLSGIPLRTRSLETLRLIRQQTSFPVIACGGIHDAATARERFQAGADLVQVYTSLIYQGPGVIRKIAHVI